VAVRTDAEKFKPVRDVLETQLWYADRLVFNGAKREGFDPLANTANDVMVVMVLITQLVACLTVTKVTAANKPERLEFFQTSVNGHEIARTGATGIRDPHVEFLGRKGAVFLH
jgi:hypothetical protein